MVACSGKGFEPLAGRSARVVGGDVADKVIEKVDRELAEKGLGADARAILRDAERRELRERRFDVVCCSCRGCPNFCV